MVPTSLDLSGFDILVVEDNNFIRQMISEILHSFGVGRVRQCEDSEAALREVGHHTPDIIICDWVMPGAGGLALLRALRGGNYPQIPVIVLSGHATNDYVVQAMGEGADSYIAKPFSAQTLMDHILKVIVQDEETCYLD